ncbi:MAG: hydroxymethylbilane synthase [Candidatus Omnitrophica bacterium]|nr:hydroxymethylbilane synthase [Candidatus Omnitrophota bacterium]
MRTLVFGIRKSALARVQLEEFIAFLAQQNFIFDYCVKTIATAGDQDKKTPLDKMGRGIFTKTIEAALLRGEIDCAVHSLKDMPAELEPGTALSCFPPRQDSRDCLVVRPGVAPEHLAGLRIGTGSPRRAAFLKELESTAQALPVRGNVETRLRKLDKGDYDGLILAAAGLKRLGYAGRVARYFDPEIFVPPAGQGIICGQTRGRDIELNQALRACSCAATGKAAQAERKILTVLNIGCQVPFGVYARFDAEQFCITARGFTAAKQALVSKKQVVPAAQWEAAVDKLINALK